ncbi:MAG: cytochrome P450 [Acidimicrobiia bacterium]
MATNTTDNRPNPEVDVCDPEFYRNGPWEGYRKLRENTPVAWDDRHQLWVLSRYAEVVYVSTHADTYCSSRGIRPYQSFDLSLIGLDDPRHSQQRRLINKGFTPRMVRNLEPRMRQITTEVLDRIADRGECDFVADIAVHVPLIVIAELMGLPAEDRERFWHWSDDMMAGDRPPVEGDPHIARAGVAFGEYLEYVTGLIDERRAAYRHAKEIEDRGGEPPALPEDLITALVGAHEEGLFEEHEDLRHDEFTMFLVLVVVAGNETTRNAMSGAMKAFSEHPDQWRKLVENPELWKTAADEVVRWVSPVVNFVRTATEDTELGGQQIRAGERVLMLYQSANRDADAFDRPDEFLVDRDPNNHVGFGVGPHFCLGANLARLEIRVVFEEIAKRFPDMRIAPGAAPVYGHSMLVHGIESMPVVFTAEGARS